MTPTQTRTKFAWSHGQTCRMLLACLLSLTIPSLSRADFLVTGSGSSGSGLSAQALFSVSGNNLVVTLTNTSTLNTDIGGGTGGTGLLTAIFFDVAGSPTLNTVSAQLGTGATVLNWQSASLYANNPTTQNATYVQGLDPTIGVGPEFAYNSSSTGLGGGVNQDYGLGSSGLGIFSPSDLFATVPGADPKHNTLDDPNDPDGPNYSLASLSQTNFNPGMSKIPLIQGSVVLSLSGLSSGFDVNTAITNVRFQFGTALSEPSFGGTGQIVNPVPAPPTAVLMGLGGIVLSIGAALRHRRRQLVLA